MAPELGQAVGMEGAVMWTMDRAQATAYNMRANDDTNTSKKV